MNVLPIAHKVRVALFHPEGVHESFAGVVVLPATETLNEPLQLFEAILRRQSFAERVPFADFDVALSGDLRALYRRDRFCKLWRIASERIGLTFTTFGLDDEITVKAPSVVNRGREGVVVDVLADEDRPYVVRLRGSPATRQFTASELELVVRGAIASEETSRQNAPRATRAA